MFKFFYFEAVGVPVLLKWDTNITTTNNIMVKQWLPQQAVLQHPNVKVWMVWFAGFYKAIHIIS